MPESNTELSEVPAWRTVRWRHAVTVVAILCITVVVYKDTLTYPFVFDDLPCIVNNDAVRVQALTGPELWKAARNPAAPNRPIANLSFGLNYFFGDYDTRGYHVVNILVHAINGCLVYWLVFLTLRAHAQASSAGSGSSSAATSGHQQLAAAATAALWTVHPVQTQAVTYIVQRMTSLATMFFLLALCLYIAFRHADRRRQRRAWWAAAFCGLLAIGSKEIAITLPIVILVYEWYFFQNLNGAWLRRQVRGIMLTILVVLVLALLFFHGNPITVSLMAFDTDLGPLQRMLTETRVIVIYLVLLFFPHHERLNLDYDIAMSQSLLAPGSTLTSTILLAGLLTAAVLLSKRYRLAAFGLLWWFINIALEASFLHIELAFEHRIYLPSIGIFLLVAGALAQLCRFKAWFCGLLAAALVLVLGYNAQQRNAVWQTPETLWSDCVRKSPGKARPYNNLGLYYANKGDYETAKQYMSKALAIDPDYAHALLNFGTLLRKTEGDNEARMFYAEMAISHFERALALTPEDIEIRFALGQAYEVVGRPEQAAAAYVDAIKLAPAAPVLHIAAAIAFEAAGKPTTALHHARRAVELNPSDTNAAELLERLRDLVDTDDAEP